MYLTLRNILEHIHYKLRFHHTLHVKAADPDTSEQELQAFGHAAQALEFI